MLKAYAKEDFDLKLKNFERIIRKLIIQKNILEKLTKSKKIFSLEEIKVKIDKIRDKHKITEPELDKLIKWASKLQNDLEFDFRSEIKETVSLINSWEKINDAFDQKNVPKQDFENYISELQDNIEKLVNSEEEISDLLTQITTIIHNLEEKKSKLNSEVLKYWDDFSDKNSIEELVNGKSLIIKNLNPSIYEELFKSSLKDKVIIKLK